MQLLKTKILKPRENSVILQCDFRMFLTYCVPDNNRRCERSTYPWRSLGASLLAKSYWDGRQQSIALGWYHHTHLPTKGVWKRHQNGYAKCKFYQSYANSLNDWINNPVDQITNYTKGLISYWWPIMSSVLVGGFDLIFQKMGGNTYVLSWIRFFSYWVVWTKSGPIY